jgi:hypothetical protein
LTVPGDSGKMPPMLDLGKAPITPPQAAVIITSKLRLYNQHYHGKQYCHAW